MSYTLDEIEEYKGVIIAIAIVIFAGCVISYLFIPNLYSVVIGLVDFGVGVLLLGNFGEWENFINTYSD